MMTEMVINLLFAGIPGPLVCLLYYRHFYLYYKKFGYTFQVTKYLESLLYGIGIALSIKLVSPYLVDVLPSENPVLEGLINAAMFEKIPVIIVLNIIYRNYENFSIIEAILCSMWVGIGFSAVENTFYIMEQGQGVILLRMLFSVPMHITGCGLVGYFLGIGKISHRSGTKIIYLLSAFVLPIGLHGLYDYSILSGGKLVYIITPIVIVQFMLLELIISSSKNIPDMKSLRNQGIIYDDWKMIYRQTSYERWINRSMGKKDSVRYPFLKYEQSIQRLVMVVFFLGLSVISQVFRPEVIHLIGINLKIEEQYLVLTLFPLTMMIMTLIVGTVNPDFFKYNLIRIPVIVDAAVSANNDYEEMMVTFDINSHGCFLRSIESLSEIENITLQFEHLNHKSSMMEGKVVWENHDSLQRPVGSLFRFDQQSSKNNIFRKFLHHYIVFRISHGVSFNLRLPGFESIRKWFVQPSTILTYDIHYAAGTTIFNDGDPSGGFYYIKKGDVEFIKVMNHGKKIRMGVAGKGTIFGEMSLAGATTRSMSAVCLTECILSYADISDLKTLVTNNPEFAQTLIMTLASRIGSSEKKLFSIIEYLDRQNILSDDVIPEQLSRYKYESEPIFRTPNKMKRS